MSVKKQSRFARRTSASIRRSKKIPVIIGIIVFVVIVTVAAVITGNFLKKKADSYTPEDTRYNVPESLPHFNDNEAKSVLAYAYRLGSDASANAENGVTDFSACLRYSDHSLSYSSEVCRFMGFDTMKEDVNLSYLLVQMADEFYPILTDHANKVEFQAEDNLHIYGDPDRLARVFNNILKNAVAYSFPGTAIRIWSERSPGEVCVCFENQGRTIPKHKLDAIFEKFYRLDEARQTESGGAGLGLAIAREIILLHGGRITAQSENNVTVFRVELPLKG